MSEKTRGSGRTRNYSTLVYPESAPENWMTILGEMCIPAFISPLHDMDVNDEDGEIKKAHYHVMIMFENTKTMEQAKEVFDAIGGVGCKKVASLRGLARYLCHLDNPEKYQYDTADVKAFAGADYRGTIGLTSDKYVAIGEMIDFCEEDNIVNYAQLLMYAKANREDWFRVLCDNGTMVMKEFLKSRHWAIQNQISSGRPDKNSELPKDGDVNGQED